jgi:small subunit ribosomal protein S16
MFRMVVQDARRTPTSGKIVAQLGSYDPHAKTVILDKEKAGFYLGNGAQPSDRVAKLLQAEGVTLPSWVTVSAAKAGKLRNPDKLRRNQQPEPVAEEAPAEEPTNEENTESPAPAESSEPAADEAAKA